VGHNIFSIITKFQFLPDIYSKVVDWDKGGVRIMVFNAIFNNISAISRWSVLLVEETGENH
jgi:hypothetical protein